MHGMFVDHDGASADKTDAAYDLRGNPPRIACAAKSVLGHKHHQRRTQRNKKMRSRTGYLGTVFTLRADQSAKYRRKGKPQHHHNSFIHFRAIKYRDSTAET